MLPHECGGGGMFGAVLRKLATKAERSYSFDTNEVRLGVGVGGRG